MCASERPFLFRSECMSGWLVIFVGRARLFFSVVYNFVPCECKITPLAGHMIDAKVTPRTAVIEMGSLLYGLRSFSLSLNRADTGRYRLRPYTSVRRAQ